MYLLYGTYALGGSIALAASNDYQAMVAMQVLTVLMLALVFLRGRRTRFLEIWLGIFAANALARLIAWSIQRSSDVNKAAKFRRWDAFATTLGYAVTLGYVVSAILPGRSVVLYSGLTYVGIPAATATTMALADRRSKDVSEFIEPCKQAYKNPTHVDIATDTRVYVTGNVIAFAGTASKKNLETDVKISDVSFGGCGNSKTRVHAGFMRAWQSVRAHVMDIVSFREHPTYVLTGHSLGGALATLAGVDLGCLGYDVKVVTFGSPQVGDELFADAFNDAVKESVRVVIPLDPIPKSLTTQFAHVKGVYYAPMFNINPHAMDAYAEAVTVNQAQRVVGLALPAVLVALVVLARVGHRRRLT